MFKSRVDKKLLSIISNKMRTNPDENFKPLRNLLIKDIFEEKKKNVQDIISVIKYIIKDKIPAKPKFYSLLLLKELLETRNQVLVEQFCKKLIDRLFKIANWKKPQIDQCLDIYYNNKSLENKEYSSRFFILLLECWKHWDIIFSSENKKIKQKAEKLKPKFPQQNQFYFMFSEEKERDFEIRDPKQYGSIPPKRVVQEQVQRLASLEKKENLNLNQQQVGLNQKNQLKNDFEIPQDQLRQNINNSYQAKEILFSIVDNSKNSKEFPEDIIQDFFKTFKNQKEFFDNYEEKILQSDFYNEAFKQKFEKDCQLTKEIFVLLNEFKNKKLNKEQLYQNLKKIHQQQIIYTVVSIDNLEKIPETKSDLKQKEIKEFKQNNLENNEKENLMNKIKKVSSEEIEQKLESVELEKNDQNETFDEKHKKKLGFQDLFKTNELQEENPSFKNFIQGSKNISFEKQTSKTSSQNKSLQQPKPIEDDYLVEREKKFLEFKKQNKMTVIEEDSNELLESKLSRTIQSKKISKSPEKTQKNLQDDFGFNFDNLKEEEKKIGSDVIFNKKKNRINSNSKISNQEKRSSLNDFEFNLNNSPKMIPLQNKTFFKKEKPSKFKIDHQKNLEKNEINEFSPIDKKKEIFIKNNEIQNQNLKQWNQKQSEMKISLKRQDPFNEFDEQSKKVNQQKETAQELSNQFNQIKQEISKKSSQKHIEIEQQENNQKSDENLKKKHKTLIKVQKSLENSELSKRRAKSMSINPLSLDNEAFDFTKYKSPNFETMEERNLLSVERSLISPKNNKKKIHVSDSPQLITNNTQTPVKNEPLVINVQKQKRKQSSINPLQKLPSLPAENTKSDNFLQKKEISEELLAQNQFLQHQCEILFDKLMITTKTMEEQKQKNPDQLSLKNNAEIQKYFKEQIAERQNNFLQEENNMLKKLNQNLIQKSQKSVYKFDRENKILKQLVDQFDKYSKNLKEKLNSEKDKNMKQSDNLEQMNMRMTQYKNNLSHFRDIYINLKKSRENKKSPSIEENQSLEDLDEYLNDSLERKTQKLNQVNAFTFVPDNFNQEHQKKLEKIPKEQKKLRMTKSFNLIKSNQKPKFKSNNNFDNQKQSLNLQKQNQNNFQNEEYFDKAFNKNNQNNLDENLLKAKRFSQTRSNLSEDDMIKPKVNFNSKTNYKNQFIDLQNNVFYQQQNNENYLKASSLFDSSIIFENQFFTVYCKTQKYFQKIEKNLTFQLSYQSKIPGLKITTHLLTSNSIFINPSLIIDQEFSSQIYQELTFKQFGDLKIIKFPQLIISIKKDFFLEKFIIPIPFSVNKFLDYIQFDSQNVSEILEKVRQKELRNFQRINFA